MKVEKKAIMLGYVKKAKYEALLNKYMEIKRLNEALILNCKALAQIIDVEHREAEKDKAKNIERIQK